MSIPAPKFTTSPYFVITNEGQWKIKDGAPKATVDEFESYQRSQKEAKEKGMLI